MVGERGEEKMSVGLERWQGGILNDWFGLMIDLG